MVPFTVIWFLLLGMFGASQEKQAPSMVQRGPGWYAPFLLDGRPVLPIGGWQILGVPSRDLSQNNRKSIETDLDAIALTNQVKQGQVRPLVMESMEADGRLIAQYINSGWYNYVGNYQPLYRFDPRSGQRDGHVKPGVYVEGMKWLLEEAAQRNLLVLVNLQKFIMPFQRETGRSSGGAAKRASHATLKAYASNSPYHGYERLSCAAFNELIEAEIEEHRQFRYRAYEFDLGRMEVFDCSDLPAGERPYWEWNLRYVIHSLRDQQALLGWYLFDEAEDPGHNTFFCFDSGRNPLQSTTCRVPSGQRPRNWDGRAGSLQPPTPDLLRYVYDLVKTFELEGARGNRRTTWHPRFVEVGAPQSFFSVTNSRFSSWMPVGNHHGGGSSGQFDLLPEGGYSIPADVLVQEASGNLIHTGAVEGGGSLGRPARWDMDPASISSTGSAMLAEAARSDPDVWGTMHLGQAQLPDRACLDGCREGSGFGKYGRLRTSPNDQHRTRLLTDDDIVWQALTVLIDGARGLFYWSRGFTPQDARSEGAKMAQRVDRFTEQFARSGLAAVLLTEPVTDGWEVQSLRIEELTDLVRQVPSPERLDAGPRSFAFSRSRFDRECRDCRKELTDPGRYSRWFFGRYEHAGERDVRYGQAVNARDSQPFVGSRPADSYRYLRVASYRQGGYDYMVLSNAYDARIRVTLKPPASGTIEEARFDLSKDAGFSWRTRPGGPQVPLEPYQAIILRVRSR